jgi:ferredoxin/flavodoxin
MAKNLILVFTGTGNSLRVAKDIADGLGDCDIVSMGRDNGYDLALGFETIGFVFPTYYRGEPGRVTEFISRLDLQRNLNAYYYAVTTMGRYDGNSLCHVAKLLKRKGVTLHYAKALDMFSNYVLSYDMRDTIAEETKQSEIDFAPILQDIKNRSVNHAAGVELLQELAYRVLIKLTPEMDKYYSVSNDCVQCGICEKVCPVDNVGLDGDGRPYFKHHCEQCMACIQFCPKKAINYKDKTQNRKRYTHPAIRYTDLAALNGKDGSPAAGYGSGPATPRRKNPGRSPFSNVFANIIWKIYGM